jgi:hypothetical protein
MNAAEIEALRMVLTDMATVGSVVEVMPPAVMRENLARWDRLLAPLVERVRVPSVGASGISPRPFMPRAEPSFDKPEMALGTPTPWSSTPTPDIEGLLRKAMEARLLSTFGMSTEATFIDTDPVLEARPKQPALPAPAPPPVSTQTMSEAWAQELARYNAAKLTFF